MIVSLTVTAATQAATRHEEDALATDASLTLSAVLSAAEQRHPVQRLLAAQAATGNAEARYGSRWMPESVQLKAFHMSDRTFDDIGANESELAVSFPVWMPGEKRAQKAVGDAAAVTRVSREAGFRWQLSGEIRRQLWDIRLARRQWQFAQEQEQRLQEVFEQVARFTEAGELARADLLSTMQQLAVWKAETIALEAEYQDAARSYRSLTSLSVVPEHIEEVLSDKDDAGPSHPALSLASDRMAEASAVAEAVSQTNGYRPTLDVFWRGFRGDRMSTSVDAVGIGFSVPLGKSPRKGPEIARAWEAYAQAESEYLQARRDVELQLHEARHQLETLQRQLHNSEAMIKTAVEKYDLDRMAFDLGELSTNQWLRRLAEFQEIERSHQLLQVRYGAAIAAYNQAVGESL
ncbi:TolC family protein [Elongatibacter sediminis]|uniref:TolC family protein n=1 Tax=Elongatibacter sediminis TaxID=3119006 RepID=A0AAW9RDN5_9GAMM